MPVWFLAVLTPGHQPGQAAMPEGPGQGRAVVPAAFCCIPSGKRRRESCWKENRAQILSVWAACGPGSLRGSCGRARWVPLVWDCCGICGITRPSPALLPLGDSLGPACSLASRCSQPRGTLRKANSDRSGHPFGGEEGLSTSAEASGLFPRVFGSGIPWAGQYVLL